MNPLLTIIIFNTYWLGLALDGAAATPGELGKFQESYEKRLSEIEKEKKSLWKKALTPYASAISKAVESGKFSQFENQEMKNLLSDISAIENGNVPLTKLFLSRLIVGDSNVRSAKQSVWNAWFGAEEKRLQSLYSLEKKYLAALERLVKSSPDNAEAAKVHKEIHTKVDGRKRVIKSHTLANSRKQFMIEGLKLNMVPVKAGDFTMGVDAKETKNRWYPDVPKLKGKNILKAGINYLPHSGPAHKVTLTNSFWIGETEVTQSQYETIMGDNPSRHKGSGPNAPVERVSWKMAMEFCTKLSAKEKDAGRLPFGYVYRLPTEAEWEFSARGGAKGKSYLFAGSDIPDQVAWHQFNGSDKRMSPTKIPTHPVGKKKANILGLYDMSGNVSEWCFDRMFSNSNDTYYPVSPTINPTGGGGKFRALRGGAVSHSFGRLGVIGRVGADETSQSVVMGFRIVLAVPIGAM